MPYGSDHLLGRLTRDENPLSAGRGSEGRVTGGDDVFRAGYIDPRPGVVIDRQRCSVRHNDVAGVMFARFVVEREDRPARPCAGFNRRATKANVHQGRAVRNGHRPDPQ